MKGFKILFFGLLVLLFTSHAEARGRHDNGYRGYNSHLNSFDVGYSHGCKSARGRWMKNRYAYERFRQYRRGWRVGHNECRRRDFRDYYDDRSYYRNHRSHHRRYY